MTNWEYYELKEAIIESYDDLIAQGDNPDQALTRVFEDFYFYPLDENNVENLISAVITTKLRIDLLNFVYKSEIKFLENQLKKAESELTIKLSRNEYIDLKDNIVYIHEKLKSIKQIDSQA